MRELLELRLRDHVFYKDSKFEFTPGLHLILGDNRDSNPGDTNGSGKSLFFGALPEALFDEPVTGKETKTKTKRDDRVSFKIKVNDHVYEATRFRGKHNKIEISKDQQPLNNERLDYSLARLQKILGVTEEEFYTLYYIDPKNRPNPLIRGTTTVRAKYLTDLFHLTGTERIKDLLASDLLEAKKAKAALDELKTSYKELKSKHDALGPRENDEPLDELLARKSKLEQRVRVITKIQSLLEFKADNADLFEAYPDAESLGNIEQQIDKWQSEVKAIKKLIKEQEEYQAYLVALKAYHKVADPIQEKINELATKDAILLTRVSAKKAASAFIKAEAARSQASEDLNRLQEIPEIGKVEVPKYDLGTANARIVALEQKLEEHEKYEGGVCPTCGQQVDSKISPKTIRLGLKKWKARKKAAIRYEAYQSKIEQIKSRRKEEATLKAHISRLDREIKEHELGYKAYELYRELPQRPEKVECPVGIERDFDREKFIEKMDRLNRKLDRAARALRVRDKIVECYSIDEDAKSVAKPERLRNLQQVVEELTTKITTAQGRETLRTEFKTQARSLLRRAKILQILADDEPVLKVLVNAYSKKGLQKLYLKRYVEFLEKQINKFRKMVFTEDIHFTFHYDTQLSIQAHRTFGKRVESSDIKRLSGAQSTLFTLLLLVATLSLIPAKRRLNFVILDEPTANMGPQSAEAFARFLPVLQKIIPVVIVITPKVGERYEGAKIWVARKEKGVSALVPYAEKKTKK